MSSHWYVDFTGLLQEELQTNCEREFQRQMHLTDGELFIWCSSNFGNVNLSIPCSSSQAILQFFSSCGCPICGVRLAISLYPYSEGLWPIRSAELAFRYLFDSLEILLNIRSDERVKGIVHEFERSEIFIQSKYLAQIFISKCGAPHNICPEVIAYISNSYESSVCKTRLIH